MTSEGGVIEEEFDRAEEDLLEIQRRVGSLERSIKGEDSSRRIPGIDSSPPRWPGDVLSGGGGTPLPVGGGSSWCVGGKSGKKTEVAAPDDPGDDTEDIISLSSEGSSYVPPAWMKAKVRAVKPKRGRPPTTEHYVGLAKAKRATARAEERLQRARLEKI